MSGRPLVWSFRPPIVHRDLALGHWACQLAHRLTLKLTFCGRLHGCLNYSKGIANAKADAAADDHTPNCAD